MQKECGWPISAFQGSRHVQYRAARRQFTVVHDAGRLELDGFLESGEGAGVFHFFANSKYSQEMSALGFDGIDAEKQFAMAVHDVSLDFARQIKAEPISGLDTDKLVTFRIHGVTPEVIRALHQEGYSPDEETLLALRIHGVTPEWIHQMAQAGYPQVDLEKLGYQHPDPDQLVHMRIHGID